MVGAAGFGGLLDGQAGSGGSSKGWSSSSTSSSGGSTTTTHTSSSSSSGGGGSNWDWLHSSTAPGHAVSTDSFDMKHIFNNHDHGGDAGMGSKHDYTHNMGNPLDPFDHFPSKGPEDKNK